MTLRQLLEMQPTPEDKRLLDGRRLAAWIVYGQEDLKAQLGATDVRRVYEWARGTPATDRKADEILIRLGSFLGELPADYWIERPPRKRRPR